MTPTATKALKDLRIMLVNDDGIDAVGIKVLEDMARSISDDVWVIAPRNECSGYSRSISLRRTIDVDKLGESHFAVHGTPTDCALVGIDQILADYKPDIVLSGINAGGNLGEDIGYSGTCGAAFEAHMLGLPAIALSQVRVAKQTTKDTFKPAMAHLPQLLPSLIQHALNTKGLLNVNLPNCHPDQVKGVRVTHQGQRLDTATLEPSESKDASHLGFYFSFTRDETHNGPGSDLDAVQSSYISVTPLRIDFTDYRALTSLTVALNLHRQTARL